VRQDLDQRKTYLSGHAEFAEKVLAQTVLSEINAVSGFIEGAVAYLVNCRMRLVSNVKRVLMGSCFKKL